MRTTIAKSTWVEIHTAYASGIPLREIARTMGIPEGTVLSRAKREGWTGQIENAKALAKRVDAENWGFIGWLLQRQFPNHLTVGAEVFHETPKQVGGESDTIINGGGIYDFSDNYHLMMTVGHTVQGPHQFIAYVAFQWTFGPTK